MKLLHLGDLHLGKSLGEFDLIDDQKYILDQILEIIKTKQVDAVLLAGDIYDKSIPSEAATNLLDYFLCELVKLQVGVYMISGNHDSDDRLNFGSSLFAANNVHISAKFDGVLHKNTLTDEFGEVDIYLLPFVKASQVKHFYPEATMESYEAAVNTIIANTSIDTTKRNVIVAHQFVSGTNMDPELGGSEGLAVKNVGLVEKIGYDTFDAFDYVALGHIHSAQSVGREDVRYSGSPLKYSLSEINNTKSVPVITLGEKGSTAIELVELRPLRDMRQITGTLEELLNKKNVTDTNDFIYAILTNEDEINDVMGIMQQTYPNTLKIIYDNKHTRELEQLDFSNKVEDQSFEELISSFYTMMYGCEITKEEMQYMLSVAREAGVVDETN